ncbi:MAG TPA: glutathione S-transferase [Candidatus Binatia bacterium]|jgi:glutathione S-transferase
MPGTERATEQRTELERPQALEPYTLHVFDQSYFSGKMQAYLAFKEIPHRSHVVSWRELTARIAPHTGLVEVPVLECADGTFLRDSTAMIEWMEPRYPQGRVLPDDEAAAFVCRLLEDYGDEGLWRPALYYRWAFSRDALLNARLFVEDWLRFPLTAPFVLRLFVRRRQQRAYMGGEGITATNRGDVERHYLDELADLDAIFRKRPYLFGARPSLADFGYFASMFRHFGIDPTPARLMRERAPAVYEWVARMWNSRASRLEAARWCSDPAVPADLEPLLARAARRYLPVLHANARAVADGRSSFDATIDGKAYPGLAAVPFQAWRRSVLQRALAGLSAEAGADVRDLLQRSGCLVWLEKDGILDHRYPEGDALPHGRPRHIGLLEKARMQMFGTPHHHEAGTAGH